jgi:hypothetical protein
MRSPRITPKEKGLLKGAMRRVFSRSDLRRYAIDLVVIPGYFDPKRPRVTKWGMCQTCFKPIPKYLLEVDHVIPVIPLDKSFDEMSLDDVADRLWCEITNLSPICKEDHKIKTSLERKLRKQAKAQK